jgi:hypothetical protein
VTAEYEIVRYRPEFREGVLRLQPWFSDPSMGEAYFRWKHERNPFSDGAAAWLAMRGPEVVGMRAFFATRWEAGPERSVFDALYADDFAIAPPHRDARARDAHHADRFSRARRRASRARGQPERRGSHVSRLARGRLEERPADGACRLPLAEGGALLAAAPRLAARFRSSGPSRSPDAGAAGLSRPLSGLDRARARGAGRITPTIVVETAPRPEAMAELVARLPYGRAHPARAGRALSVLALPEPDVRVSIPLSGDGGGRRRIPGAPGRSHRAPARTLWIVDWEAAAEAVDASSSRPCSAAGVSRARRLVFDRRTRDARDARVPRFPPVDVERTSRGYPCLLVRPIRTGPPLEERSAGGRPLLDRESWDLRMIYSMHG